MRILMLDNEFPPLGGGTGVVNYHLLKEWSRVPDVTVDLVTSSRTAATYEIEHFSEQITLYKVPVDNKNIHHSTNTELLRYSVRGLLFCRTLLHRSTYDLSFAFAGVPAGVLSAVLGTFYRLQYVVSLQGPDVPGFEARYNSIYPFLKPILRYVWRHAAAVTAISRQHRDLAHQTLATLPIPIIYNGVETDVFFPVEKAATPVTIVCVGRLIERKGQHHLLHAFARVLETRLDHQLRLQLVGTGDAEDQLRQLARELGIEHNVEFLGFIDREGMPAIYQQAHIFVLPSQSEGMSIALLEAMASGLPVIVTDTGGTDELVTEGVNGMVVPWADRAALTKALLVLIDDAKLRHRMGTSSREKSAQFSWAEISRQYLSMMQEIVASGQTSRTKPVVE